MGNSEGMAFVSQYTQKLPPSFKGFWPPLDKALITRSDPRAEPALGRGLAGDLPRSPIAWGAMIQC